MFSFIIRGFAARNSRTVLKWKSVKTGTQFKHLRTSSTMEYEGEVLADDLGEVCVISINRPKERNAVNTATAGKLVKAVLEFEQNENYKVGILTGTNGTFCAGYDLKELSRATPEYIKGLKEKPFEIRNGLMGPSRMTFSKPVIAAVSGYAVAGGLELALLCDLRVVEEDAIMGVFCRRFGVPLIDGGTVRLPRVIGFSRALDLTMTGRPVKAAEAYRIGLADRVVPKGQALETAIELAKEIAKFPQECMKKDRMSIYYSSYDARSLDDALQYEYYNGLNVIESEAVPGASNFAQGKGRHGSFDSSPSFPSRL